MKTKIISTVGGIVVFIIAIYATITWWSGSHIEQDTRDGIEALNEHLADGGMDSISVKEIQYQRGIFSSEAVYLISLAPTTSDTKPVDIKILSKIDHGPLPLWSLLHGQFAPHLAVIHSTLVPTALSEKLFSYAKGQPFIEGQSLLDLNGDLHSVWTTTPLSVSQDGLHTELGSVSIKINVGANLTTWQSDVGIPSLTLANKSGSIAFNGVRLYNNSQQNDKGLTVGTRGATVNQLSIQQPGLPTLKLDELQTRLVLNQNDRLLDGVIHYETEKLTLGAKDFGKLNFLVSFDHLSAEPMKSLVNLSGDLVIRSLNQASDADLVTNTDIKAFWQQVQTLLKDKPTLHLNPLVWDSKQGSGKFELHLALAPVALNASGVGMTTNPLETFHANLNVSRPLATSVLTEIKLGQGVPESKAQALAEKEVNTDLLLASIAKVVKIDGNNVAASLTLEKNTFKLNGNPVSTSGFLNWLVSKAPLGWLDSDVTQVQGEPDDVGSKSHFDSQAFTDILTANGHNFEQRKDEQGDPVIQIAPEDTGATRIEFVFVGCGSDPTCEDVVLRASYDPKKPQAIQHINQWNKDHSLAKARIGQTQEPILEMDVSTYGGLSKESMQSMVNDFFGLVKDLAKEFESTAVN